MTKKGYITYKKMIKEYKISKILKSKEFTLQKKYDQWRSQIERIEGKCKIRVKIKREKNKTVRLLMRKKRILKKMSFNRFTVTRRKLLNKHILEEKQRKYANKIRKVINESRRNGGGMKEESFWEFKRKLNGKRQEMVQEMENKEGKLTSDTEEIKKIYQNFYEELFERKEDLDEEDEIIKKEIETKIKIIEQKANSQEPMVLSKETIRKVVKKLKRRKAADCEGWR